MPTGKRPIILDTHAWIWLFEGDPTMAGAADQLNQAGARGGLQVAAISVWELAMLAAKGRIKLSVAPLRWVRTALTFSSISLIPLSLEIAVESAHLPADFHGDPADRMIVASARILDCPLATRDCKILEYGRAGHVNALPI